MKSLFYRLLKIYCRIALRFYFRQWQIVAESNIPDGPVILVANHQNAFLDAVLVACSTKRNPWFLARANVFQKEWAARLLALLKMMPVYRFRDGFSTLRKNDEMIERCASLLAQNEAILIFAEGNHSERWALRPLQKGFARIALAARDKMKEINSLHIVPVGLQFEAHSFFRSRVLVTFGSPIQVLPHATVDSLVEETQKNLIPLMLHVEEPDYEQKIHYLRKHRVYHRDLAAQLKSDQEKIDQYEPSQIPVTPSARQQNVPWWNPFFTYGLINHFLSWWFIRWVLRTKVEDPQFIGSLKFALGMVAVPLSYLLQAMICWIMSSSLPITLVYVVTLPVSGLLSHFLFVKANTQRA